MQGGSDPANVERGPVWLDRVTAPDLMLIWPEEQGWAQYIGALVTLDGTSLFDANGGFLIEPVREAIMINRAKPRLFRREFRTSSSTRPTTRRLAPSIIEIMKRS